MKQRLKIYPLWLAMCALAWCCFSENYPTLPKEPRRYRKAIGVTQGSGSKLLLKRTPAAGLPILRTNTFAWRYAAGSSNYWWALQVSTDLRTWTTVATNVTGDLEVTIVNTGNAFYRLKGTNAPY